MLTISKFVKFLGICVSVILLIFSVCGSYMYLFGETTNKKNYMVFEEMNVLKYHNSKYELVIEVDKYIHDIAPQSCLNGLTVVNNCVKFDIDICFVLAQGQIESHFGMNGLARKTNSVWNVFAFDGLSYDSISYKGKYSSPDESVEPYLELLNQRYLVNGKSEYDMMDNYVDLNGKRYASAPNYEEAIRKAYTRIKGNTKIDSLSMEMKKYSIILGY